MIDFYTWSTPDGYSVAIMLEESGLDYQAKVFNPARQEDWPRELSFLSSQGRFPVIVDTSANSAPQIMSGAVEILSYLAGSGGFVGPDGEDNNSELQTWLTWPIETARNLEKLAYFIKMDPTGESEAAQRLYAESVVSRHDDLNEQLKHSAYIFDQFSIADMAVFPHIRESLQRAEDLAGHPFPQISRWVKSIENRPAVGRAYQIGVFEDT